MSGQPGIEIVEYDRAWPERFEAEAARLRDEIGERVSRIEHVGSTSVPGLAAKPIVDICPMVPDMETAHECSERLRAMGYTLNAVREEKQWIAHERVDETGQQFNVHVRADPERIERYLRFRDFLRDHPDARDEYARIKRAAAAAHPHDVSAYTDEKTDFVESILERAREAGYEYDL